MASTTITISPEAHERLKAHKQHNDSFTDVILREVPPPPARNAGEVLERLQEFEGKHLIDERRMKVVEEGRGRRSKRNASR